jgi:hypothetical protein
LLSGEFLKMFEDCKKLRPLASSQECIFLVQGFKAAKMEKIERWGISNRA